MGLRCKRCGGEEHVKNGLMRGKQRYLCKGHLEKFIHTEAGPSVFKGLATAGNSFRGIFRGAL